MSYKDFQKDLWGNLTNKDRQILTSVAINAAANVNQGKGIPVDELCKYAEAILGNFWEFSELQKPSFRGQTVAQTSAQDKTLSGVKRPF